MKKLFTLFYYIAAIIFGVLVFFAHYDLFMGIPSMKFDGAENFIASLKIIIILLVDAILFLRIVFGLIRFLIYFASKAQTSKKMIKCVAGLGGYFVSLMVAEYLVLVISAIGTEEFMNVIKSAGEQSFYIPLALVIVAGIILLVARIISRGGPISGIFVLLGVAILVGTNILYYRDTCTTYITSARFIMCLAALGLAVVPGFMPDLRGGGKTSDN